MAFTPRYLLGHDNGKFFVFDTAGRTYDYDIISYRWGKPVKKYDCGIDGVNWPVKIHPDKLEEIKDLMLFQDIQYMWVDSVCINKTDKQHASEELSKMFQYYKQAQNCYLLIDMPEVFDPHQIADDLKLLDHILSNIGGASMVSDTMKLSPGLEERRRQWAEEKPWIRGSLSKATVRSAGIDLGVMNCYNTCISHVKSLFENEYFTRVWTFQEMILGKNIQIVGVTGGKMSGIGSLYEWMELASDCRDKATKLYNWISNPRAIETASISLVLILIEYDKDTLLALQTMIGGINAARTDIINGGQFWWLANPMGVSNIFSAISITPRGCRYMPDLFRGLLGIFSGLFTAEEIRTQISGNDIEKISFAFFKRLSTKTGNAWTKLSISARERGEWDWIPVVEHDPNTIRDEDDEDDDDDDDDDDDETEMKPGEPKQRTRKNRIKTDIFAGVANLGYLREKGRAKTQGLTGLHGVPRKFMSIRLKEENPQFHFIFRGCNCGKKVNAGFFKSEAILTYNAAVDVTGDETGRTLAQCATILGCLLDPAGNVLEYKSRLLRKLNPQWEMTDPGARPSRWPERCVSGTIWADASCPFLLRTHNMSMNYRFGAITECESRLAQGTTANISCEVRINCGCTIVAPFSLVFEALMAVEGSSLGGTDGKGDKDGRIVVKDGLGLVQIGDLGKTFNLVAFGGDLDFHRSNAALCRKTKKGRAIVPTKACPMGRALIRSDFTHDMTDVLRNYGYVQTGVGNLLICRDHPLGNYKIRGVCIDNYIATKNGQQIHGVRIE